MTIDFKCEFCDKAFIKERTLINHICEKKRRWMQRDEQSVRLAFNSWLRWYKLTRTNRHKKTRNYMDFMNSREYISFVKFGRHIVNTNLINPTQFIDFVIENNLKLKDWTKDSVFEWYSKQITRKEDIQIALERFVKLAEQWAEENDKEWTNFFGEVNIYQAYRWIITGRISPWILLNAKTANNLWNRLDEDQLLKIQTFIEPPIWKIKMNKHKNDLKFVKDTLEGCNI